jgi:hypothetical protein
MFMDLAIDLRNNKTVDVGTPPLQTEFEIKNAKHNSSTEECYVECVMNDRDNLQLRWIAPKVVVVVSKFLILIHPKPILLGRLPFCPCSTPIPSEFAHDDGDDVAIARRKNKKKTKRRRRYW